MAVDRSTRILVAVDASYLAYVSIFAAERRWKYLDSDEYSIHVKEPWKTDQRNLPDITAYETYRRALNYVVQERIGAIEEILKERHPSELDCATGVDIVFAFDSSLDDNFRKKLYPKYKAQRRRVKSAYDHGKAKRYVLNVVFKDLRLEETKGYRFVKVDGCECDDIIAAMMSKYTDYMCRVLISSDHDFLQLKDVHQYDLRGNEIKRVVKEVSEEPMSRRDYLLWKIIFGDTSDNIEHVFEKVGKKKSYALVQNQTELRRLLNEDNDAAERFKLNMSLIDFRKIPTDLLKKIEAVLEEKLNEPETAEDEKTDLLDFALAR